MNIKANKLVRSKLPLFWGALITMVCESLNHFKARCLGKEDTRLFSGAGVQGKITAAAVEPQPPREDRGYVCSVCIV